MKTPFHSAYWAHALTLQGPPGTVENLSRSIANARVDLNPHQVDAALFAVRSPFTKGVLLADEVGLGKTIEAGIVIAQRWAERRRRILLIVPATLRKQWQQEIEEKFSLPTLILESANFNLAKKNGEKNPFDQKGRVIICSYHFAAAKAKEVRLLNWDLVVIDEAHRLRNVYKPQNKMANAIVDAVRDAPTVLLTATPLQNSLLELYGLVSVIDPHVFGDLTSFREQFVRGTDETGRNMELKRRLAPLCRRTLRKQVLEYIRFTQRVPITQDFLPTDDEHALYEQVSEYLQREILHALPASQRTLMTLILRRLLASSTFAIAGTLRSLIRRLEQMEKEIRPFDEDDFEAIKELEDEWTEEGTEELVIDRDSLREELKELRQYADLAERIRHNAKGDALLKALEAAFVKAENLGAPKKAVIFTESRRTQKYLHEFLGAHGYGGQIVLMNGTNTDPESRAIYERWRERHAGSDLISGSKSADTKAAIVEEFRDRATLLIATESAAEGVNLQFCSLVVNYDLPWNPQRIEQRIGRCHRYGQKHDVVVVNFLNRRNAADQRVFQLLDQKFRLFNGVFGASDEVLGALESGVDIERRIAQVYQECRTAEEIQIAFDKIQADLDAQIAAKMDETRRSLLENFDEEVHARIKLRLEESERALGYHQELLLNLTKNELNGSADWFDATRFRYTGTLGPKGTYNFHWKDAEAANEIFYRPDHTLAQILIAEACARDLSQTSHVRFDLSKYASKISALEPFIGKSGWLRLVKTTITSIEAEDRLTIAAITDDGNSVDDDLARKLFALDATVLGPATSAPEDKLRDETEKRIAEYVAQIETRNAKHFDEEVAKLEAWAEDLKFGLEQELKEIDREIRDTRRAAGAAATLAEKLAGQKKLKDLDAKKKKKRAELFDAQDTIDEKRDQLIGEIEAQLKQRLLSKPLFTVRWTLA